MKKQIVLSCYLFIVACQTVPIVDTKGVNSTQYNNDLLECQRYAQNISPANEAARGGFLMAFLGAVAGAALGASMDLDPGSSAAYGAAVGGVSGASSSGAQAKYRKERVVRTCLRGRGYKVLD